MEWTLIGVDEFICSSSLLFTTTTLQTFVEKQIRTSSRVKLIGPKYVLLLDGKHKMI